MSETTVRKVWRISARIKGIAPRCRKPDYHTTEIAEIDDTGEAVTLEQVQGYFSKALEIAEKYRLVTSLALTCEPNELTTYHEPKGPVVIRSMALYSPRNQAWKYESGTWYDAKAVDRLAR